MPKFRVIKTLFGDYGLVHPGQTIDVPEHQAKKFESLVGKGVVDHALPRPTFDRKSYVVFAKPTLAPPANKAMPALANKAKG